MLNEPKPEPRTLTIDSLNNVIHSIRNETYQPSIRGPILHPDAYDMAVEAAKTGTPMLYYNWGVPVGYLILDEEGVLRLDPTTNKES